MKRGTYILTALATSSLLLCGCSTLSTPPAISTLSQATCESLTKPQISADQIGASAGLKSGTAVVDSAICMAATPYSVLPTGPTPEARINPATPEFCKVLGPGTQAPFYLPRSAHALCASGHLWVATKAVM